MLLQFQSTSFLVYFKKLVISHLFYIFSFKRTKYRENIFCFNCFVIRCVRRPSAGTRCLKVRDFYEVQFLGYRIEIFHLNELYNGHTFVSSGK